MSTIAADIRLPLTITSDVSGAVKGLRQIRAQGSQLSGMFSGIGGLGGMGGMLGGFLGVGTALAGIKMIMKEADKLQAMARTWSPDVAVAHGETQIAEMEQEKRRGQSIAPIALEREKMAQAQASVDSSSFDTLVAAAGLQMAGTWDGMMRGLDGLAALVTGNTEEAMQALAQVEFRRQQAMGNMSMAQQTPDAARMEHLKEIARNTRGTP